MQSIPILFSSKSAKPTWLKIFKKCGITIWMSWLNVSFNLFMMNLTSKVNLTVWKDRAMGKCTALNLITMVFSRMIFQMEKELLLLNKNAYMGNLRMESFRELENNGARSIVLKVSTKMAIESKVFSWRINSPITDLFKTIFIMEEEY